MPVGALCPHHLIDVQSGLDANTLSCLKCQGEISSLVLAGQLLVRNVRGEVGVQQGTERQPVVPAAAEVCDVDILVAFSLLLTPLQKRVPLRAPVFSCERR